MTTTDPHAAMLAALATAAELAILLFLYRDDRARFFAWIIAAWALRTAYFLLQLGPLLAGPARVWAGMAALVSMANSLAFFGAAVAYRGARRPWALHGIGAAGAALAAAMALGGPVSPASLSLELGTFEAAVLIAAAIGFWPRGRSGVRGTGLLSASLLAWAVVRFGFGLALPTELRRGLVPAATLLQALQLVLIVVVVLASAKQRVEFLRDFNDTLIDNMALGLVLVAPDLTVTHVNRWVTERLGPDVRGRTCVTTYLGSRRQCPECPWRDDRPSSRQLTAAGPGGRTLLITCSPLAMPDGSHALLELLNDVTEQEAMRARLLHSERLATIGRMAARVAHEVRNPLGVMAIHTDLAAGELQGGGALAEAANHLAIVKSEIRGVAQLIESYLRFGRLPRLAIEPFDVEALVDGRLKTFVAELGARGITLRRTSAGRLAEAAGDPEQLGQALVNVIRNAIEAMPAGGELSVRTAVDERAINVEVSDTGAGVRPEDAERIFRPFETTKSHGTGLGLAVAREIVQEHGGTLVCRPREGGAMFIMAVPVRRPGAGA